MNEFTELEDGTLDLNHECKFEHPEIPLGWKPIIYEPMEISGKCKCGKVEVIKLHFNGRHLVEDSREVITNDKKD